MTLTLQLIALAIVSFLQNMAFTWTSRARNSADPKYLWIASVCSNAVFFVIQVFLLASLWPALTRGDWWTVVLTGVIYVLANSAGAVYMMRILLKVDTGRRRPGANG